MSEYTWKHFKAQNIIDIIVDGAGDTYSDILYYIGIKMVLNVLM